MISQTRNNLITGGYVVGLLFDSIGATIISTTKSQSYNPFVMVFYCFILKMIISLVIFSTQNGWATMRRVTDEFKHNSGTFMLYSIPAFLYFSSDVLWYVNLSHFDPFTYNMLWQFRIVATGIVYQMLFHRMLSRIQWSSLVLLTFGCIVKQLNYHLPTATTTTTTTAITTLPILGMLDPSAYLFMVIQIFCSCFAGVYTEYLLKGRKIDLMIQNVFMYINSSLFTIILLFSMADLNDIIEFPQLIFKQQFKLIFVLMSHTYFGLMTSLYLKHLNSVFRTFGTAVQITFTAFLSWFALDIPIDFITILSIVIVISALVIYVKNPIPDQRIAQEISQKEFVDDIKINLVKNKDPEA